LINGFAARTPVVENAVISSASSIWICWWQGPDNMPEIVKACYKSVQKYAAGHPVKLITKDNFNNFVSVPEYILDKFNSGLITVTHFSDILRVALLYEYGGFWLDATMFLTKEISISNSTYSFFTLKGTYNVDNISKARWTGFCIAGVKYGILFEYMRDFFYLYWKTHNELIDYVLIDYVIETAYQLIPYIRSLFDKLPYNNTDIYSLQYHLHSEFSKYLFAEYCSQTQFHKLTWKKKFDIFTTENKLTFYGYLIEMSRRANV
jgi:hypothetical protein